MRQYKHRGCKSVMYTYVGYGDGPLRNDPIRSIDWLFMGGRIPRCAPMDVSCPDCKQVVSLKRPHDFESTDGKPFFG